jgi:hypothetical protein
MVGVLSEKMLKNRFPNKPWNWSALSKNDLGYSRKCAIAKDETRCNAAATIIQRGCHNWLYSPVCKDSTPGINCRPEFVRRALGDLYKAED